MACICCRLDCAKLCVDCGLRGLREACEWIGGRDDRLESGHQSPVSSIVDRLFRAAAGPPRCWCLTVSSTAGRERPNFAAQSHRQRRGSDHPALHRHPTEEQRPPQRHHPLLLLLRRSPLELAVRRAPPRGFQRSTSNFSAPLYRSLQPHDAEGATTLAGRVAPLQGAHPRRGERRQVQRHPQVRHNLAAAIDSQSSVS